MDIQTAKQIFDDNSRQYGNGLQKFEPNDLNKGIMLDLSVLNEETKEKILNLYKDYRFEVLRNNTGKDILEKINQIIIQNYT